MTKPEPLLPPLVLAFVAGFVGSLLLAYAANNITPVGAFLIVSACVMVCADALRAIGRL
jgi:hypothetical protein